MAGRKRWLKATIAGVEAKLDLKIGDLVLAKVKGFPAWPAKISDPEDWGVSPDSRKIFVHYFGTNQIGFCKKSELRAWNRDAKRSVQEKSESKNATADYCRAAREILEVDEKRSSEVNFVDTGQINTDEQSESRIAERTPSITLFGVGNSGGLRDDIPEDNFVNTGQSNTDEQPKSRIIERTPNIILFKRVKSRTARSANRVLEAVNATNSDCGDIRLTSDETLAVQNGCSLGTQQVKLSSGKGNNSMECANGDAKVQDTQLAKNPKIVINYQKRSSRLVKCSSFVQSEKEAKNSHLDTALRVSTRETDSSHFDDANKDNTFRETGETTAAENTTMDSELIAFGRESNAKNEDETKVEVGLAEISMDSELSVFGREANAKNEDETKVRVGLAEIPVDSELSVFGREANAKNEDETKMKVGLAEIPRDIIPFRRRNFRKRKYTSWMLEQDADIWNDERASTEGAKVAQNQESMELPENTVSKVGNGITTACLPVDDSVDTGLLKFCRRANLGHRNANRKIGSVEISENENPPIRTDLRISGTIQDQKDVLGVFFGTHISDNQVQKRRTESLEQRSARLDQTSTGEKANYIEFNELEKSHIEMKKVIENPCVSDQLLDLDRYSTMENIGTNAQLAETCEKLGSHITMNTLNFEPCDEKRVPAKASMNSEPLEVDNGLCGLNCDDIFDRDVGENYSLTKENAKGEMKTNKGDSDLVSSEISDMGNTFMKQENLHHASKCSGLHAAIEHKKEAISTTKEDQMEQDADNLKEKGASAEDANVPQNQESVELPEGMVLKASTNSKACLPVNGSIDTGLVKFRRRTISRYQNVNCKMGSVEISDSENPRQRPDSRKTRIAGSIQDSCVSNELLNLDINPTMESTTTNAHVAEVCEKLSSQSTVNTQNFESCVEKRVTAKALMNSKPFENDKNSFRLSCDDKFDRDVGENPYLAKESRKGEMKTIVEGSGIMGSEVTVMENTCKGQETLHHGPKCSGVPASNEQTKEAVSATIIDRKDEEADNLNDMRASTDAKLPRNQDCMELPEGVVSKAGIDIETRSPVDGSVDIELVRFCRRANSGCWNVDSKISSVEISVSENPPKRAYLRNTRSSGSIQDQKDNLGALCRTHMAAKRGQKRRRSESLEQRDVGPEQAFAREKIDCIEFNDLSQSQVEIQAIVEDPGVSDQLLNVDRNPTVEDTSTNAQLAEIGEKLSSNINMNLNNFESCNVKRVSAKVSMNSEPLEDDNDLCVLNCDAIFVRDLGENSSLAKENKIGEMKINEEDSDVGNICTEQESMQNTIEDMKEAISATKGNQMEQDADNLKKEGISAEDAKVELPKDVVSKTSTNITKACLGSDASVDIGRVKLCRRANSGYQNLNSKVGCIEISDSANPPKRPHLRNTRSSCSIQDQKDVLGALCRTHMSANRGWKRRKTESLEQRDARLEQACTGEKINCIEFNELKQGQVKIQTIMEDPCISNELLDLGRHPTTENTATNAKLAEVCERLSTHVTMNTQYFEYCDENRIPIQASMNSKPLEDDKDLGGLNCDDMFARDVEETPLAKDNPKGEMKTNEEYNGIMVKNCTEQENLDHTANEQTKKAVSASKVDQKCCEEAEILHLDNKTEIIEEQKQAAVLSTLLKPETALLDSDVWHNTSKEIEERSSNQFNAFSVNAPTVSAERNAGVDSCCFYNSKVNGNGTPKPNSFEKREASEMCNKLNEKDSQNLQSAAIMPQFKNFQEGSTADEEQLEGSRDGLLAAMQTRFSVQSEDIDANDFSGCYDWTVQGNCPNMAQETQEETEMQEQQLEPSYGSLNGKEAMLKDEQTGVMEASALKQIVKQTRLSPAAMPLESRGCIHIVENLDPSDDDVGNLERQGSSVPKEFQEVNKQLTLGQTGLNNKMKSLKQTEMEIEKNQLISHLKESTKMKNESSASLISTLKIKGDDTFSRTMQEIEVAKEAKHQIFTKDGEVSACSSSMRYLIAVAQAKRQAKIFHVSSLCQNVELEKAPSTPLSEGVKYSDASTHTTGNSAIECIDEEKIVSRHLFTREDQKAVMARATLEAMLRTLTRTKESISKATRHAVECVKHGIAQQAIELIVRKLELESSYSRRIDLFFLIDSITQCSHQAKGIEATIYPSAVQKLLPRLLKAAAPSGIIARENRRQCLRVLRIWLQRNVMPEAFLKPFIGELEVHSDEKVVGKHHCPPRCQRSVDDPIREMEGMQVDEYGSNAAFSLPGLLSQLCDDEEDISDGVRKDGDHSSDCIEEEIELTNVGHKAGKYNKHILEDVDGELEMEVSPSSNGHGGHRDCEMSNYGQYPPLPPMPCPPDILPPSPPPLPLSPPPSPPPPPPPSPPPNMASSTYYHSVHTSANSVFPHVNQPQYTSQLGFESGYSFPKFSPFTTVSSSVTGSHVEKYSQPQSTASNSSTPAFRTALNPFFRADSASYAQASINQSLHGNQEVSSQCIQSPHADRDYPSTSILCPKAKPWQISQVDSVRSFYHQTSPIPRERPNITRGTSRYRHDTGSSYGQYDDHFSHIQLQQPPQPVRGGGLENYKPQQGAIRQGYWRLNGTKDYNG